MTQIILQKAYLEEGWRDNVLLELDARGHITKIQASVENSRGRRIRGYALPTVINCHSHAFQRAMAGLAEYRASTQDSFWTWRQLMYHFAGRINPEDLYHLARGLYLELAKGGYGGVCEFHYLHHQPGGVVYDDPAELSLSLMRAAAEVGLALTLLPVMYMTSGFGASGLLPEQRRFALDPEAYATLWASLKARLGDNQSLGLAFHSLRAVPLDALREMENFAPEAVRHIHIAEQVKEVEDCRLWCGQRPVDYLMSHVEVDERWCLVHATHLDSGERQKLAQSGAVAGLCPTTEANLGDGLFPLADYLEDGGCIAIGSDSHVSRDLREELRWLEYGQRLWYRHRNLAASVQTPHTGERLLRAALMGGARASGLKTGALAVGQRADLMILDPEAPAFAGCPDEALIDSFVFNGTTPVIKDVMVRGQWIIRDGRHKVEDDIVRNFRATMEKLLAAPKSG
ncbi:formimidoylglutamate deiminase [Luteithermobacter gelatinilyticus]|uniref:formimidoylglutamate deiminase n=1 Tax=Luteithermobacter gelatinilyticus TaxID=2582913 RepID=UPI001106BFBD|nr:formimidoylglutamate deiminase [Luteithermobacter gelatinilyticus]